MEHGQKVAGGDRLGKTIIFAKNRRHAHFIGERFDAHYPHLRGQFARVITHDAPYAQSLIDAFSKKDGAPHIAISVDMLDTGIDVPAVVNLVFFKTVRSRTKFWQMIGRGTRLCPDLFGPGEDKTFFNVFDFCGNLEFFALGLKGPEGRLVEPISSRIFKSRLELIRALDQKAAAPFLAAAEAEAPYAAGDGSLSSGDVRRETAETLRARVAAMNPDNFLVRPKLELVERFSHPDAWIAPTPEELVEASQVAALPSQAAEDGHGEEAKQFDLMLLRLQLAVLKVEPRFELYRKRVQTLAQRLEEKASIPLVAAEMELIQDVAQDEWWQDVTVPMLERARKRLRRLVHLVDKGERKLLYTDFADQLGGETPVDLFGLSAVDDFERFRAKARAFLKAHEDHVTIHKLRLNQALTPTDLAELEGIMLDAGIGADGHLERAKAASAGLGLFIRSLVGLDREAAKLAFGEFLAGGTATANQITFVNLIIEHLTEHGQMAPKLLYQSPFTDVSPTGPDKIFTEPQVERMVTILRGISEAATAA
jgi:type I restriction enzyme R subunit